MVRIDAVLAWDQRAVEAATKAKKVLAERGMPIGNKDTLIAGYVISEKC